MTKTRASLAIYDSNVLRKRSKETAFRFGSLFVLLLLGTMLVASPLEASSTGNAPVTYTVQHNIAYGTDPRQILDIYEAPSATALPLLVLIHGGGWTGGGKGNVAKVAAYFAENGYVVANIDYRLSSSGVNLYPTAITDVSSAIAWLKVNAATYDIDATKIAAAGTSVGGYLALEAANEGEVDAVADFYGPVNLADPAFLAGEGGRNAEIVETYLGATLAENPALYAEASPINYVSASNPPTIIFQGALDQVVPVAQSESLATILKEDGVVTELVIVPTAGHSFLTNPGFDSSAYLLQALTFLNMALATP